MAAMAIRRFLLREDGMLNNKFKMILCIYIKKYSKKAILSQIGHQNPDDGDGQ
jgi:hypothetical protein